MSDVQGLLGMDYARQDKFKRAAGIKTFRGSKSKYQQEQECYTKEDFEKLCKAAGWVNLPNGNMAHERYVKDMTEFNKRL